MHPAKRTVLAGGLSADCHRSDPGRCNSLDHTITIHRINAKPIRPEDVRTPAADHALSHRRSTTISGLQALAV